MKAIEFEQQQAGLQCDAEGCDWVDKTIPDTDYPKWLNAPCPKCGANVLTQEDYDAYFFFMDMLRLAASIEVPEEEKQMYQLEASFHKGLNLNITKVEDELDGTTSPK